MLTKSLTPGVLIVHSFNLLQINLFQSIAVSAATESILFIITCDHMLKENVSYFGLTLIAL